MTKAIPHYLRIHRGAHRLRIDQRKRRRLWRAFAEVTGGHRLPKAQRTSKIRSTEHAEHCDPSLLAAALPPDPGFWFVAPESPSIDRSSSDQASPSINDAVQLTAASALADEIRRLERSFRRSMATIRRQEAALARLPAPHPAGWSDQQLIGDLQRLLRRGVLATRCTAAGLYLLDDDTTSLKLRAATGLPNDRLLLPPRPLRGAVGDLEALLGQPVVLDESPPTPHWECPERCQAAAVVRVCQADHPIGTLWLFRERAKKFRRHDLASAELLAGQLAAALERDALLGEAGQARTLRRDVRSAALQQQTQLPVPMPLAEGWDVAGWLDAPLEPSGQWYHWDITRDGRIALVVASDAGDLGRFGAAINAAQLRAAWQIASMQMHQPAKVLQAVNDALWQVSTAPQPSNLFDVRLSPESGAFDLAAAGSTHAIIVGTYGYRPLVAHSRPLGTQPDVRPITHQGNLQPGEILLIATDTLVAHQSEPSSGRLTQTELIAPIQEQIGKSAEEMLAAVRRRLVASKTNRSMVVLSRSAR